MLPTLPTIQLLGVVLTFVVSNIDDSKTREYKNNSIAMFVNNLSFLYYYLSHISFLGKRKWCRVYTTQLTQYIKKIELTCLRPLSKYHSVVCWGEHTYILIPEKIEGYIMFVILYIQHTTSILRGLLCLSFLLYNSHNDIIEKHSQLVANQL